MLFLPSPVPFQLPGSPFPLPKRQISPLFLSAAPHGMLPASGPGGKFPSRRFRFRQIHGPLRPLFPILRLFRPSLFLILSFFYISIYRQPKQSSPDRKEIPCCSDIFLINKKVMDFPGSFERGKRPPGGPCIRVSENVSGNPLLYKSFFLCLPVHGGSVRFGKLCLFPEEVSAAPSASESFSAERSPLQTGDFAARESGHEKKSLP